MPLDPPPPPKLEARTLLAGALVLLLAGCLGGAAAAADRDLFKTLAVGVLGAVTTLVGFYFGSSKSSAAKDATISALADKAPR